MNFISQDFSFTRTNGTVMNIAVTGYPSSGKSIATQIAEEVGFHTVIMGDHIRQKTEEMWEDRLNRAKNNASDESVSTVYGKFATQMREEHGNGIVAEWCSQEIDNVDGDVFIDGMRSPEERYILENKFDIELIYINSPASLRLERMRNRGRDGEDSFNASDIMDRDQRENEWGLNELVQSAEHTIHNCTTVEKYEEDLQNLLIELLDS